MWEINVVFLKIQDQSSGAKFKKTILLYDLTIYPEADEEKNFKLLCFLDDTSRPCCPSHRWSRFDCPELEILQKEQEK